ncbi:MAG: glycosyltransferase [Azoarcus sp.]|nr:glycosyltransferase [Azoarcus sp.]
MSKGTIFYVGGFELPDRNAAAHRVLANGKIMRELGYDVVFVGVDSARASGADLLRHDFLGFECWNVSYPVGGRAWLKYILGLTKILDFCQMKRPAKVVGVICYNYPAVAQWRMKLLCRRFGIKMLSDATEWYDASGGSPVYRVVKSIDTALRMHIVHRLADGVITTSKYLTDFYSRTGKVTVELPTLFDADRFQPPLPRDNALPKRFIYVGSPFNADRINRTRSNLKERLDVCIEVFHHLYMAGQNFSFEIYGIEAADYLNVFPEHAGMLQELAQHLVFRGKQSNEVVLKRISECDFSIFFRDETRVTLAGFPSKLAESISCGTPVVSNKMPSLENHARSEGLFLAARGDELDLVRKVMEISHTEIDALKQRTYCSRTFDYRNYTAKVSAFLTEVGV